MSNSTIRYTPEPLRISMWGRIWLQRPTMVSDTDSLRRAEAVEALPSLGLHIVRVSEEHAIAGNRGKVHDMRVANPDE